MTWFSWFASLFAKNSKLVLKGQAATVRACGYLPMAETVAALISPGNPTTAMLDIVAHKICAAVTKPMPTTLLASGMITEPEKPVVEGVTVEGEWLNPK